jgi:hypothetical protein
MPVAHAGNSARAAGNGALYGPQGETVPGSPPFDLCSGVRGEAARCRIQTKRSARPRRRPILGDPARRDLT